MVSVVSFRVLESLLVSLTTTVVVFIASMVLGECRQMSSSSHSGNGTLSLQVRDSVIIFPAILFIHPEEQHRHVMSFLLTRTAVRAPGGLQELRVIIKATLCFCAKQFRL